MSCRKLLSEISNYLDGEIDPAARRELEEHIAKCPNCLVVFDTTRKTVQIYQGCCEPYPVSEALQTRLREALKKHCEKTQTEESQTKKS